MRLSEFKNPVSQVLDKPDLTPRQIASKFNVDYTYVMHQLQQGIKVEMEHTSNLQAAKEIALDHLAERPDYYERLKKVEEHKKGRRAVKYNKKPQKFIEPVKPQGTLKPSAKKEGFTELEIAIMEGGHSLEENFADGKNPGRKGLAKRSGVNCKASVSTLRNVAKHSSGEKARMAHWCANMKSGRANESQILSDLEEGWKDWVAGAAIGAAALGAHGDAEAAKKKHPDKPAIVKQIKADPKLDKKVADIKKQVNAPSNIETNNLSNNPHAEHILQKTAIKAGIKGVELAQFMAQTRHESADFGHMKEIGGSLDFKKYDPKFAPKTAKILGNKHVGDGARYKGRGFIQITGRDNYRMAGDALGLPLEQKPELASTPEVAAKIAVWYWQTRVKPSITNFNDTAAVTKKINPALRGLENRIAHFKDYKNVLNIKA